VGFIRETRMIAQWGLAICNCLCGPLLPDLRHNNSQTTEVGVSSMACRPIRPSSHPYILQKKKKKETHLGDSSYGEVTASSVRRRPKTRPLHLASARSASFPTLLGIPKRRPCTTGVKGVPDYKCERSPLFPQACPWTFKGTTLS
jgi:hypothetical protein